MTSKQPPITQALLARAHSPASAERIFTDKIQHRTVHLRPTSPPPQVTARAARRRDRARKANERKRALKPKPLSAKQRRALQLYTLPQNNNNNLKYAAFVPLHQLWLGYVREILGAAVYTGGQDAGAKLSAADLHGADVEVVRSGCVGRVGIRGIVVKDTRFVLEIITPRNQVKTVPKEGTIFRVVIPPAPLGQGQQQNKNEEASAEQQQVPPPPRNMVVELLGDQLKVRAADRASRKFKQHFLKNI